MVVTVEPHATDIGVEVLKSGGNAIDAAVAIGFALAVTHPSAGNLGGGGFLMARFADGRTTFLNFRERAPQSASRNMYLDAAGNPTEDSISGYRASAVPGTVKGLEEAHRKYGKKPWAELIAPAVNLAAKGFPLTFPQAEALRGKTDLLSPFPDSKRIFLRNGRYYEPDDLLIQPELARTLDRIRRFGAKDFYEGETARLLAAAMKEHGGLITLDDLKHYTVEETPPLKGTYRGYEIVTAPPPRLPGGVGFYRYSACSKGPDARNPAREMAASVHIMAEEPMSHYFADRSEVSGRLRDPFPVPVPQLLRIHLHRQHPRLRSIRTTPPEAWTCTQARPVRRSIWKPRITQLSIPRATSSRSPTH